MDNARFTSEATSAARPQSWRTRYTLDKAVPMMSLRPDALLCSMTAIHDHLKRGLGARHRNREGMGRPVQSNEIYRHCHRPLPGMIYLRLFLGMHCPHLGFSC
jgi:hypothetical protein